MNPILQAALASVLRHFLTIAATTLFVKPGIWTGSEAESYVAAGILALLSFGWAVYQKWRAHQAILTALDLPQGSTVAMLDRELKK